MTKQQTFILVFTFIVGMSAGAYMYVTSFAPQYEDVIADDSNASLLVVAEEIGGCQMLGVCSSFRLKNNRSYEYIPAHNLDEDTPEPKTGKIGRASFLSLTELINETDLGSLQKSGDTCESASDGTDYVYDVLVDGISYELNSCGTTFYDSSLYQALTSVWSEIEKAVDTTGEIPGAAEIIIDRFGEE